VGLACVHAMQDIMTRLQGTACCIVKAILGTSELIQICSRDAAEVTTQLVGCAGQGAR
jgi:hypothetical protein